jgi:hypothetical protein
MNSIIIAGETRSLSTVNSMMRVLNEEVRKDSNLAFDLLLFLQERHIEVPILSNDEIKNHIPVSFKHQNSSEANKRIQLAFEGISLKEDIL